MEHPHYPSHPAELAEQDAFRAARRDGLYSTDSVAILQLSRYATPLSVYLDKVEPLAPSEPASLPAWLGWRLEGSLALLYHERYGGPAPKRLRATYSHLAYPFVKTHLDYAQLRQGVLIEGKTRGWKDASWGEDGTTKVPPDVWVQCQHELMVMRTIHPQVELCRVPVLFGLRTFHVYEVWADPIFHERLLGELERFWREHVLAKVPPEPIALGPDIAWGKRHEMTDPTLGSATPEQEALLRRVRMAALAVSQAEEAKTALDIRVKDMIGERAGLMGTFGTVTYKPTKGKTKWELLAGTYERAARRLLELAREEPWPDNLAELDLIRQQLDAAPGLYTEPGTRTLRYSWKETDGE